MAVELDPTVEPAPLVYYRYVVVDDNGGHLPIAEGGALNARALSLAGRLDHYPAVMEVRDFWKSPSSMDQLMLSAAFTEVVFNDASRKAAKRKFLAPSSTERPLEIMTVRLALQNPRVERRHIMGVIGSSTSLGSWEDGKVTPMSGANFPLWEVDIEVPVSQMP